MPELPEVESIKSYFNRFLIGHKIVKVQVNFRKALPSGEKNLVGGKIIKTARYGKAIAFDLDNNYSAVIHLKMTGQLIYRGPNLKGNPPLSEKVKGGIPGKHSHVIFHLDRGGKLYFNDYRKFGWIKVVKTKDIGDVDFIKKLGPEPLKDLDIKYFREVLSKSGRPIKLLLLDQSKLSGVGNIYANDALWLARIHPERKANSLNPKEEKDLLKAVEKVLKVSIAKKGSSDTDFVNPDGSEGSYQERLLVYDRKGKPCRRCKTPIEKIKVAGRGTYLCPSCQK